MPPFAGMTRIRFDGCDLSPRSAWTPRFALIIAAALLVLAGCGGDGRMGKAEYERTMNAAGLRLGAVFGTVDVGTQNASQLAVKVKRARSTLEAVRTKLEDVKPPEDAERPHAALLVALTTLSADLRTLARAAESGYPKSIAEARARLNAPGRQVVSAIQQLQQAGFDINNGRS
jgi:hypothetical protein